METFFQEIIESFYIPKGFAHGFKTLERDTELYYMMDQVYQKEYAEEIIRTQNILK